MNVWEAILMKVDSRKEILFYYESRQNPNGDPGFENQPRLMPDETIMVTDVRLKRTIRDYAKKKFGKTIFADYGEEGLPVSAEERAKEIVGKLEGDIIKKLLSKTFDVPLFGALVPLRKGKNKDDGGDNVGSCKLTGPLQFGLGRSVNKVSIINPTISGVFVGDESKGANRTFGKFYSVEYALIKFFGVLNPANLGDYIKDSEVKKSFDSAEESLFNCIWCGTNELITRSKFPQRSVLYLEVEYKEKVYCDLPYLVEENDYIKGRPTELKSQPFKFDKLIDAMTKRKSCVEKIRIAGCDQLKNDLIKLAGELKNRLGSDKVEVIEC